MAKRLSRGRLVVLNQGGQAFASSSAGGAFEDSIGSYTNLRNGAVITTDVQIDLANATAPVSSFSSSASPFERIIGVSSSAASNWNGTTGTNPHGNAQILRVGPEHGVVTDIELICVEAPTGGTTSIGLMMGSAVSASSNLADLGTEIISRVTQVQGRMDVAVSDTDALQGKYLYLKASGSDGTVGGGVAYTAGKFVLRLHGFKQFSDV